MAVNTETGTLPTITANDIIERAYRILGDTTAGESLTADQADIGLDALNSMLDAWAIEKLMIFQIRQDTHTWPASTTSQTIGVGADFDTRRPVRVEQGTYFKDSQNIAYHPDVIRNRETYDRVIDKTVTSSYPELIFYEPSMTWGTLYVFPIPAVSLTLYLNQWQPLQIFDSLTEAFALPPGYWRTLTFNLAVELESETGLSVPTAAARIAATSKKSVKRANSLPIYSYTETGYVLSSRGRSDIVAGE